MSFVPLYNNFEQSLLNTKNLILMRENIYLPSMRLIYVLKNVFGRNILVLNRFSNCCCTFCDKLNARLCHEITNIHINRCKISAQLICVFVGCLEWRSSVHITKTCPCKIQRFFQVKKNENFTGNISKLLTF